MEDWRIKISVLWIFYAVTTVGILILSIAEPGALQQFLLSGEMRGIKTGPEYLLIQTIVILVPLVMAFLSVALKDSVNRWANIIVGMIFVVLQIVVLGMTVEQPSAWMILIEVPSLVALALIVWYAWKAKQKT